MFFLLRTAFWLSIVIVLLPTPESMKVPESRSAPRRRSSAASATVSDMSQFCARQPEACEVGSQALTQFGHKAQAGAKMVYEFLTDEARAGSTGAGREPSRRRAPADHESRRTR